MTDPKGKLATLIGFDSGGTPRPLLVDASGSLQIVDAASKAAGNPSTVPKGSLITPCAFNPSGVPQPFLVDGDCKLIVTGLPSSGIAVACHAYLTGNVTVPRGTVTKVNLNGSLYNVGSGFVAANSWFVVPAGQAGNYQVIVASRPNTTLTIEAAGLYVYKNGASAGSAYYVGAAYEGAHRIYYWSSALVVGDKLEFYIKAYYENPNSILLATVTFMDVIKYG